MTLSVIIPIYNVEATLERCLLSVLGQAIEDMEVVLVDDGSTDNSLEVARHIIGATDAVTIIHQENQGLSGARNTGLAHCHGDYITFVDSDDSLLENTYRPLMALLKEHPECDILEYSLIKDGGKEGRENLLLQDATYHSLCDYWLSSQGYNHTYACNKIFKRDQFFPEARGNVVFPVGRVFEDMALMAELLKNNPLIMTSSHLGYVYNWNPQGITATANGKQLRQLLESQLDAAQVLDMAFLREGQVGDEEAPYYLAILNNQISVCRETHEKPTMPECKVSLHAAPGFTMKIKAFMLNTLGLNTLCRLMRMV